MGLKLVILPLFLMGLIGLLSVAYGVSGIVSPVRDDIRQDMSYDVLVDSSGRVIADTLGNVYAVEDGELVYLKPNLYSNPVPVWSNGSLVSLFEAKVGVDELIYTDGSGVEVSNDGGGYFNPILVGNGNDPITRLYVNFLSGGLTALFMGALALVCLVGLKIVSTGFNEVTTRMVVFAMFYSGLWFLVSSLGIADLTSIPVFGWVLYMVLSFCYFLGVWEAVA